MQRVTPVGRSGAEQHLSFGGTLWQTAAVKRLVTNMEPLPVTNPAINGERCKECTEDEIRAARLMRDVQHSGDALDRAPEVPGINPAIAGTGNKDPWDQ